MTLTLAIAANALLDLGVVAGLAYVMTRPAGLDAHRGTPAVQPRPSLAAAARRHAPASALRARELAA